jgi:O-glycosyl hydrolase
MSGGSRAVRWQRLAAARMAAFAAVLVLTVSADRALAQFFPEAEPTNAEIVFGCEPGPVEELHHADPPVPPARVASPRDAIQTASLRVATTGGRVTQGHGFNLEHTLWSCPDFRRVFDRWLLTAFQPDVARVDSGQLPFVREDAPIWELGRDHYHAMMDDPKYAPSWEMLRRLNQENVQLMLGVWGGPGQFNDDGTRRGALLPEHATAYAEYVAAVVEYLVVRQGVQIWSVTVANEPDGGDGTFMPPELYVEVARQLGPMAAQHGVTLYGPDTASAGNARPYFQAMAADPTLLQYFSSIATHEYFTTHQLPELIADVRAAGSDLPVYITEYTSFRFGAMDRGQESTNEIGHMLDSLQVYASLMNAGADAAIYWDAVDYYQAGHAAITRWGILQGPSEAFAPRTRYYGFQQVLPYVQAGSTILPMELQGPDRLAALAIGGGERRPHDLTVALINRGGPTALTLTLDGPAPQTFEVYVTNRDDNLAHTGRVTVNGATATVTVPARSVTTLSAGPPPDEDQ